MANDIARIGFAVDTSGLSKGEKSLKSFSSAGEKTERSISGSSSGISSSLGSIATAAKYSTLAIAGFSTAAIAMLVSSAKANRELSLLASQAKMATSEFRGLAFATEQYGISGEQIADISKDISDKVGEFATAGTGAFQDYADAMGLTKSQAVAVAQSFDGLSSEQVIGKVVEGLESVNATSNTTTFVLESLGNDLSKLTPLFSDNSKELERIRERFDAVNKSMAITASQSGDLNSVAESFGMMATSFGNASTAISASLAPQFDSFFNAVIDIVPKATNTIIDFINSFQDASAIKSITSLNNLIDEQEEKISRLRLQYQGYSNLKDADLVTEQERQRLMDTTNRQIAEEVQRQKELEAQLVKVDAAEKALAKTREGGSFAGPPTQTGVTTVDAAKACKSMPAAAEANTYQDWIDSITAETTIGQISALEDQIAELRMAMDSGDLSIEVGTEAIEKAKEELEGLQKTADETDSFANMDDLIQAGISSLQTMADEGSTEYKALGVAADSFNAIQAIGAVISQGVGGDPYTAIPRMAAMAAAVAALGQSVGSLNGGFEDTSAANQEAQGLNVWGEKSESIANSVDITADATDKLVGINTDMLKALEALQVDLSSAAGLIIKETDGMQFNPTDFGIITDPGKYVKDVFTGTDFAFLGNWVGTALGSLLGGSSSVVDEGIKIIGGTISNLIDDTVVIAFQDIQYKTWAFGGTKSKTVTQGVSSAVEQQFGLVFGSLADTVIAGAQTFGMSLEEAERAVESYRLGTIEISTKGLSASAQQDEIEAVFSSIFDKLSLAVIPYLDDFQAVGESMGETFSRLATEIEVVNYAVEYLGITMVDISKNPRAYTEAADNLSTLLGGVDEMSSSISSFISEFADESAILEIYTDALTSALKDVGLSLPATASGMYDLIGSLDGTTAAGQEQIATVLSLTETSSEYYDLLNDLEEEMASLSDSLAATVLDIYDMSDGIEQVGLDAALAAARVGDFSLAESLNASDYALDMSDFETLSDYNTAQAEAANKLIELSELAAAESGDVETRQLDELKAINEGIIAQKAELEKLKYASESNAKTSAKIASDINRIVNVGIPEYI